MLPITLRAVASAFLTLRWYTEVQGSALRSEPEKRLIIRDLARLFGHKVFVETGTYLGKTTALLAEVCDRCITVELDDDLFRRAREKFAGNPNVTVLHGDSGDILPQIIRDLNEPAIFWLDGHFSGGMTARAAEDTPIGAELRAVLDHPVKEHLILVDDARYFRGRRGYPTIRQVLQMVEPTPYKMRVIDDIIRIYRDDF